MGDLLYICVLILYKCPHTICVLLSICVLILEQSARLEMGEHTSAYVSIRQHTSVYVSMEQSARLEMGDLLYICVSYYMCPDTRLYMSAYYYTCIVRYGERLSGVERALEIGDLLGVLV